MVKVDTSVPRGVDLLGSQFCKYAAVMAIMAYAQRDGESPLLVVMHHVMLSRNWFLRSTIPFCCGMPA